ncbi:MAG: protoheme IX farnesyltransferase [Acidobacteria bacterium]|nr:protoheme IX farnesyltransferase [Acidobacteriota bacterium]
MKDSPGSILNPPAPLLWERTFDFIILTKPKITSLVLFTTFVGFYTGIDGPIPFLLLFHTLAGTALMAGGAGAFNMYIERQLDVLMKRTALRPLAAGRLQPGSALIFALAISISGFIYLYVQVNHLTSMLSAIIFAGYLILYTPLKTKTWVCTFIGAVPGALPAVLGWTAAKNAISYEPWILFAIVFLWQMPHFYAIGWMHREDYKRAGFSLLPAIDCSGRRLSRQALLFIALLVMVTTLPYVFGTAGIVYMIGAAAAGITFLAFGWRFARSLTTGSARLLFIASALYLPLLMIFLILNKIS